MTTTWLFSLTTSGASGAADDEALRAELQTANKTEVRNVNLSIRIKIDFPLLQVIASLRQGCPPILGLSILGLSIMGLSIMGRTG
jgi:hypothetical protein